MRRLLRIGVSSTAFMACMASVAFGQHYTQTNLASNTSGNAQGTDPQLVNPWGLSRGPGSAWWVADNVTGLSTLYNGPGEKQSLVVTIPSADPTKNATGTPAGIIFNGSSTDFLLAPSASASFLFATIDGTIAGWNPNVALAQGAKPPSTHAVTVVKTTDGSSYTGLTSNFINGKRYLYAANFTKGRIDVYDNAFHPVTLTKDYYNNNPPQTPELSAENEPFVDDRLPPNFVPFNVQSIGDDIVVTYALHENGQPVETDGPGLGFVDVYTSAGQLLRRLEHGDWLNAPWGVCLAPLDFGSFSHDLLVAQFAGGGTTQSGGFIAAYDLATGKFDGLVEDAKGNPISISGIWALSPANVSPSNADPHAAPAAQIYFTAGPDRATGGLFGYLTAVSSELIEGSDQ
jgi:uncharacterized protein (TIGR03118 family)